MKGDTLYKGGRYLLGLFLLVLGVNVFVQFMPAPEMGEAAMTFMGAIVATGYIMPLMGIIFILAGVMFLADKAAAFANVLVAPFTVNILMFHLFLGEMGSILFGLVLFVLQLVVAKNHMGIYRSMWK